MTKPDDRMTAPLGVRHPLVFLSTLSVVGVVVIATFTGYQSRTLSEAGALQHAKLYAEAIAEFRTLYTSEVVEAAIKGGLDVTHDYAEHPGTIPLPATLSMILGKRIGARGSGARTRLYSAYPFPWRKADHDKVFADPFSKTAWTALSEDPSRPFHAFGEFDGHPVLRYATADRMRASCIECHNSHRDSPKTDWKLHDVRGVLEVILPLDASVKQTRAGVWLTVGLGSSMALVMLGLVGFGLGALRRNTDALALSAQEAKESADKAERAREEAEELVRSNQDLEQFAYVASHDLRAPLRKIRQFGDLLVRRSGGDLPEESADYIVRMTGAAARMDLLISDLLALSRVSADSTDLQSVNLFEVAAEVLDDLEVPVRDSGGRVQVDPLPTVRADRTQMRMLLQNLIANGLKFRRPDVAPEVRLRTEPVDGPGGRMHRVFVTDNGIGFDPSFEQRIFEVFKRLHAVDEFPGTGIGLAICKKIVERHGGTISATSDPDGAPGATFTFTLPEGGPERSANR